MLLPTLISVAGLLVAAAEAAPRGAAFNKKIPRDGRGLRARVAARSDSNSPGYDANNYGPSEPMQDYYPVPPKNPSTSATGTETLDPSIQCPTGGVYISTKTVDTTLTVTASSNMSHIETYRGDTETATSNNPVYQQPNKYVSTGPYGQVYPGSKTATEQSAGSPYQPGNATYLPPYKTKTAEDPEETEESWTDEYPYMNSTLVPSYTAPIDRHASETDYQYPNQTKVYSTPGGYDSAPPAYTKPAYNKPVYSDPASGNSTTPPFYTKPAYAEPMYSDPSSGNSTIPPVYTKPAYSDYTVPGNSTTPPVYTKPIYTRPAYSEPVIPGNSSTATPLVYTRPVYTDPVVPGNSSTAETSVYTPPPYTKPVYSEPVVPSNYTEVPPVYTKPVDTPIYTPPGYTKPVYLEPAVPNNSTDVPPIYTKPVDTPIYTPPVYTKPVDTPVYTPPVDTNPVYSDPVTPESSWTIPPLYTRPADTPVYTPPVYRDSSDAYPQPSIDTNYTVPPVYPTPSSSEAVSTAATPTDTCVIDSSMVPISTSYLNATATTMPPYPTETVCEHTVEDGALRKGSAYCGVHGEPVRAYFIAEYIENRHDEAVTLEGCYQFCSSSTDFTRGCKAYRFYHDTDGNPRCALYRMPVSSSASELDGAVEDLWFDLTCGSPTEDAWHQDAAADHRQTESHGGGVNFGFGFGF